MLISDPHAAADAVIQPARSPLHGEITAQPSKNYTTRYLLAAALASGESIVRNCATSDDSRSMQRALRLLGARVDVITGNEISEDLRITGVAGKPALTDPAQPIDVGNAGAVLRMLLGVGALVQQVTFTTIHNESLGKRPNADLLTALESIGCTCDSRDGMLPITLHGGNLHGGDISISGARSSQFLSSLLFLAPLIGEPVHITVCDGLVSRAPVRQTLEVLRLAGISVQATDDLLDFRIDPQHYRPSEYAVNGDWPGSAAILAASVLTGGEIQVHGLFEDQQGERESERVLRNMGGSLELLANGDGVCTAPSAASLRAVDFDGDLATDAVLALLAPACFAPGRSRFYNVANLRIKECDRITEPLNELRKLGVKCWEGHELNDPDPDAIIIEGNPAGYDGGITVDGRGDHRVIMLLSAVALRCRKPVRITGAHHVAKSYPGFFQHLAALGADVTLEPRRTT